MSFVVLPSVPCVKGDHYAFREADDLISKESHCLNKQGPRILCLKQTQRPSRCVCKECFVSKPCLAKDLKWMGVGILTLKKYLSYLGTYTILFMGLNYTDFKLGKRSETVYF